MHNFTNETINTSKLPKYEEVQLQSLHADYWKVILIGNLIFLGVLGLIAGIVLFFNEEARDYWYIFVLVVALIFLLSVFLGKVSFRKRGYAFRQHDVLYKSGIISETTTIIPFNRIQHVALHEGVFARIFGLASIGIYTAGGGDSDIDIPGIEKEKALQIKQLLMNQLTDGTQLSSENDGESEL